MSFSARLKEQRERMGLTQIQLATALGITKGAVGNYETGASSPKAEVLYKLFDILHCDANFLFQDEMAALHEANASPQEMECLVKKYRLLDPYGKEAVDGVLDVETRRCEAEREKQTAILVEQREQTEAAAEIAPEVYFITPGFLATMSAGTGQPADDEYPKNYRLKKEPPRGTSYIAPVSGDSMEPTYHDGDKLFIRGLYGDQAGPGRRVLYGRTAVGKGIRRRAADFPQSEISAPPHNGRRPVPGPCAGRVR